MQHEIEGEIVRERLAKTLYEALLGGGADKKVVDDLRADKHHWELLLLGVKLAGAQFQVLGKSRDQGDLSMLVDQVSNSIVDLYRMHFGEFLGEVIWTAGAVTVIELMADIETARDESDNAIERMTKS